MVEVQDGALSEKLMAEMAAIICKANMAYRNTLRRIGTSDFWKSVPQEALEEKRQVTASSNYLLNFLDSGAFVYGPEQRMPLALFKQKMVEHANRNSFRQTRWVPDFFQGPFAMRKLTLETVGRDVRMIYHGKTVGELDWVKGCDIPPDQHHQQAQAPPQTVSIMRT